MATATQKNDGPRPDERVPETASISFLVFQNNDGEYRWSLLNESGESVAQSAAFRTYDAARAAAEVVRDTAGSARFERRPPEAPPVDRRV